ncbi:lantibiotic dehydratase C-terminal domain-containing protein [Nocardiopsis lambiniae]|uniref:Lantibiotic dehydratase C-terminal domain-containing protein n=1 Tax=Nocardiopsis lambiniae TaxID=3075539 RepID=A0ABU2M757_9ACTN|nr:lantibiotic dehydratase C-terminal domain-containing protein [Nocardiopsis sp. DSM 44743]MDT0328061.1 lantibiotic dehydratase C-terminal domain-containing protein [Nocardiopsis sp. DSM 44743]
MTVGLRVTYYDSDKTALLGECLVPAALDAAARPGVTAAWPHLHWRLGPHCSLYLDGEDAAVATAAADVEARARSFLERRPSTATIDPERYAEFSARMGRLELVEPPYAPLEPDNSIRLLDGDPVDTFLRGPEAIALKGRVLTDGLALVADRVDGNGATAHVFAGMGAIASRYPEWGLRSGYQAFLSHWKEYFHWSDPEGRAQARLAGSYRDQRADLVALLGPIHEGTTRDPSALAWLGWTRRWLPEAVELARRDHILPYPHQDRLDTATRFGDDVRVRWSGSDERSYSDFHREFRKLDFTRLGDGYGFAAFRFVINCFFDLLPLMGVSPIRRYSIAYLFTEAAQEVVGETWEETVRRVVAHQQSDPELRPTLPWVGDV